MDLGLLVRLLRKLSNSSKNKIYYFQKGGVLSRALSFFRKDEINMSLAMKCDRCGKLYEFYDNGDFNGVSAIKKLKNQNYLDRGTFDLCPECRASFDKWLHLPEIEKNATDDDIQSVRRKLSEHRFSAEEYAGCIF
jgi:hypothetical protein